MSVLRLALDTSDPVQRARIEAMFGAGYTVRHSTYWNMLPFPLAILRRKLLPPATPASDVGLFLAPIETGFNALMAAEHAWLGAGGRLPFGNSVLTVAQKSQQSGSHTP